MEEEEDTVVGRPDDRVEREGGGARLDRVEARDGVCCDADDDDGREDERFEEDFFGGGLDPRRELEDVDRDDGRSDGGPFRRGR